MDSSLRDRSTDDIVPIDSQLQLTTDSDYSFVNSTPMKMTASTPKNDKPSELIGKVVLNLNVNVAYPFDNLRRLSNMTSPFKL